MKFCRSASLSFVSLLIAAFACTTATTQAADYLGPQDVTASPDGRTLYVALHDARQLGVFDVGAAKLTKRIDLPASPTTVVLDPSGATLYIACAAPKSIVCAVNTSSAKISRQYAAGHTASGLAVDAGSGRLYVCNRFDNDVSVIELASGKELARVPVVREPVGAVVTSDGGAVFVINHLPLAPSDSDEVAAEVTVIHPPSEHKAAGASTDDAKKNAAADFRTSAIRLPNGSTSCRDIAISSDGRWAYVTHILARYQTPTTQLERGWMNTNALSIIDAKQHTRLNTMLLDNVDLGAANPWGVAISADDKKVYVTHAGTHEISVIAAPPLIDKLRALAAGHELGQPSGVYAATKAEDVPNDLALLQDMRRRIKLYRDGPFDQVDLQAPDAAGPRGLAVAGSKAYVACYFTDNLAVVDLEQEVGPAVRLVALGPQPQPDQERIGEMLFNDARLCFQHWQSCASCHPDARMDGLNWDLLNDGFGNPKNVKSMLLAHRTPPAMISAARDTAEAAVRAGIRHIQFAVRPEEDAQAIDAYLKALEPVPSPRLVDGKLSPAAERGKKLFFSAKVGCALCHPQPLYTDLRMHDVGSKGQYDRRTTFDTPTLIECWRTAPYLHDGHFTTLEELFRVGKHGTMGGALDKLSNEERSDLIAFVLSL